MKQKLFVGKVRIVEGKKTVVLNAPDLYQHHVNEIKEGSTVSITLEDRKPKRTVQQNSYLFGVYYPLISNHTGYTVEEVHELFKSKFLVKRTFLEKETKKLIKVIGSTTKLSKQEFSEYIEKIEEETGIIAPPVISDEELKLQEREREENMRKVNEMYPQETCNPKF